MWWAYCFDLPLLLPIKERTFAGHAQRNSERLLDFWPKQSQFQGRPTDGIHHPVVNMEATRYLRCRRRGNAEVNRVECADALGVLQRFARWLAAETAIQSSRIAFHANNDHCRRVLNVAGITREAGPPFFRGDLPHLGGKFLSGGFVINRGGLDVVYAARFGCRAR